MEKSGPISSFYAGRSVFVTGATGFMGKVLIEKLLWSCPDIKEIFLLMRLKKNIPIDDRLRKMLTLPLFDRIRENRPQDLQKLIPVIGDVKSEGLGLPPVERQFLIDRVSVIFHVAASVRFDDPLRDAVFINCRSTRDICILAANMKKLVSLLHVSSTYSHTDKYVVEEKLYPYDVDWKKVIKIAETVDDHTLRVLTPKFMEGFPNTYTFTKRLAECVVADYAGILPIAIFRPSIVISSMEEPMPGWLDNFNGPVGLMVGGGKGVLRVAYVSSNISADFMPVDVAIKAMIVSTWKRGSVTITQEPDIHVYNCSSADIKSISMAEIGEMGIRLTEKVPLEDIIWRPAATVTSVKTVYYLLTLILHLLPAYIIDFLLKMAGKKPMLVKLQRKVYVANSALEYFLTNEWKFRNEKMFDLVTNLPPIDDDAFGFELATFDIHKYFENCIIGAKKYLLKEDMNRLPEAKVHYDRMYWIDMVFKIWLTLIIAWGLVHYGFISYALQTYRSVIELFTS
uniref:Fatty acyl-CoA reductase n=1 Tax=Tetrastichus brontispae TaxID=2033808 RepID=A0A650FL00_9HYME|nr:FAR5 [Tetrastichus brontispae]